MGSFITCGIVDKYIIFSFIPPIFLFLYRMNLRTAKILEYPLLLCLISSLSMCLSIIPFLILKKRSKSHFGKDKNRMDEEAFNKFKKKRCQSFYFIIIVSILDYIHTMLTIFNYSREESSNHWAFEIIIINLISYCLLKIKLYKHHYLCIIIITISGISLNVFDYLNYNDKFIYIIIEYTNKFIICLEYCLDYYAMEKNYTTPYEVCFYIGFFSFFLSIIIFGILIYEDIKYLYDSITYFYIIDLKGLFLVFAFIILNFLYNLCFFISIKKYNPNYMIMLLVIGNVYSSFNLNIWRIIRKIIIAIIFVFIFLIYNEIIEINCCGLEKNTKRNIRIRARLENSEFIESINEVDNDSIIEIDGYSIEINGLDDENIII